MFEPKRRSAKEKANARGAYGLPAEGSKLAAARWAICALESQGHLVGTVAGPPSVGPAYQ